MNRLLIGVAALLAWVLFPSGAAAQRPPDETLYQSQVYDGLLNTYRSGDVDGTIAKLDALVKSSSAGKQLETWLKGAREKGRVRDVECVMTIYSEAILRIHDMPPVLSGARKYMPFVRLLRTELRRSEPRSVFLRRWYSFWEAMLQGVIDDFDTLDEGLDLLPEALATFPDDPEILLAAGSRYELIWWLVPDNPQRDPSGGQFAAKSLLTRAADYLRRSVAANSGESEARLRLARVLGELGQSREGLAVLADHAWTNEVVFDYLSHLIEGDLHERLGDVAAASAAYDKAIPLIRVPQSARIAKAYLEHQSGARQDAVAETIKAASLPADENDPWWLYICGQLWRREPYLKELRSMVKP